jgi:hypothetical protein
MAAKTPVATHVRSRVKASQCNGGIGVRAEKSDTPGYARREIYLSVYQDLTRKLSVCVDEIADTDAKKGLPPRGTRRRP